MSNKSRLIADDLQADQIIEAVRAQAKEANVAAIARDFGVSRTSVYRWMGKNADPRMRSLSQLAKALGMELIVRKATTDGQSS